VAVDSYVSIQSFNRIYHVLTRAKAPLKLSGEEGNRTCPSTLFGIRAAPFQLHSVSPFPGRIEAEFAPDKIEDASLLRSPARATRESHFAHTQADSFRHGGNIPPLWPFSEGNDVRLIGLSWNDESQVVLARPDSNILTVSDLKGRTLAVPSVAGGR
jgi:hypothetical protein